MNPKVPKAAAAILDLIGKTETGREGYDGYTVIYGQNQRHLPKPIVKMTVGEILAAGPTWAKKFGSSATGRYQFMAGKNHTLSRIVRAANVPSSAVFLPDLQDALGLFLLRERGYDKWIKGDWSTDQFMIGLAKEWASFPVPYDMKGAHRQLKRGQSYYAGDGLNKALLDPSVVWTQLERLRKAELAPEPPQDIPEPPLNTSGVQQGELPSGLLAAVIKAATDWWRANQKA
jgi:muramidase (phage lysozyme)